MGEEGGPERKLQVRWHPRERVSATAVAVDGLLYGREDL